MKSINTKGMFERKHNLVMAGRNAMRFPDSEKALEVLDAETTNYFDSLEPFNAAINEIQGKATERTIDAHDAIELLDEYERKLGVSKKALEGTAVWVDRWAQVPPKAYKYPMMSTQFSALYKNGSWRIADIARNTVCRYKFCACLSDAAKEEVIDKLERVR